MNRRDPRIRQTLDRIADTLETANQQTQHSLFTFSRTYVIPCLASLNTCLESSCYPCVGAPRDRLRARQNRLGRNTQRGRPELVFDFYNDDWDDPEDGESAGLLAGWGNDELDRLLAGNGSQPQRHRPMTYGTRGPRRKSMGAAAKGGELDPTIVPGSSMFGFLERLPWKIGSRNVRYKPSASDLQEHPGRKSREEGSREEGEALIEESEGEEVARGHQRQRSNTNASKSTANSLSSRGDLFPSDGEDDAIALDDEFDVALQRRNTSGMLDDVSSGKTKGKRFDGSRSASMKTESSKDTKSTGDGALAKATSNDVAVIDDELPSIDDLRKEDERVRREEAIEVEKNREEARRLALERGLATAGPKETETNSDADGPSHAPEIQHPASESREDARAAETTSANPTPVPESQGGEDDPNRVE